MKQTMYIQVKDSQNNWNIWQVIDELEVDGQLTYEIHRSTTVAFIEKEDCFCEAGSPLLYYKNGNRVIDIQRDNAEYETEEEHKEWKRKQNRCINPFVRVERMGLDFGYLEDMSEKEKWEHLQRRDNYL